MYPLENSYNTIPSDLSNSKSKIAKLDSWRKERERGAPGINFHFYTKQRNMTSLVAIVCVIQFSLCVLHLSSLVSPLASSGFNSPLRAYAPSPAPVFPANSYGFGFGGYANNGNGGGSGSSNSHGQRQSSGSSYGG